MNGKQKRELWATKKKLAVNLRKKKQSKENEKK